MMALLDRKIADLKPSASGDPPRVSLDTNCVLYYLGSPPAQPWADWLRPVFEAGANARVQLCLSNVAVAELLSQVHLQNRADPSFDPELDLMGILRTNFELLDVTDDVAK